MSLIVLWNEIQDDPLLRGYSGMTDAEIAADLNTAYRERNRTSVTGTEILNAVNKAEYNALTTANKELMWNLVSMGELNPFGIEADLFVDMFGGGSTTISQLQALRVDSISRAAELGLSDVNDGLVIEARKAYGA